MTTKYLIAGCLALLAVGCSTKQLTVARPLDPPSESATYRLESAVTAKISRAAKQTLRSGTRWQSVGRLAEGLVLKSPDQSLVVNSFHVNEGYPVVAEGKLVGFYLPVPKTFVAITAVPIQLEKEP